jgi:hypothetical protein
MMKPYRSSGFSGASPHSRSVASINFVTAHDGFTLRDLLSYNEKDVSPLLSFRAVKGREDVLVAGPGPAPLQTL